MIVELLQPVLVLVVGYLLRLAFRYLKIELDEGAFNAILLGIVAFLLALVGAEQTARLLG
jgi:hypothetical protein